MCSKMMSGVRVLAIVVFSTLAAAGVLLAQSTTRVSVDSQGTQANRDSGSPSISADGRLVAFESNASNLVPGDTNWAADVFVHDRQTGKTMRVSLDSQGEQGNGQSRWPAISADGRFVAFWSAASNLVSDDTNDAIDIFVKDLLTGEIDRVNLDSQGHQSMGDPTISSIYPTVKLSANGSIVAFSSGAGDLVDGDLNQSYDVFVRDRLSGETTCMSVNLAGVPAGWWSWYPEISWDGRFVTFESPSPDLVPGDTNGFTDVFIRDRVLGQTTRVSVDSQGGQASGCDPNYNAGGSWCRESAISGDDRFVTFSSDATNLVPGDTNRYRDVFIHDLQTAETTRVSVDSRGGQAADYSEGGGLSGDGRLVVFWSWANNLVPGDTNGLADVFVHDCVTGQTSRASVDSQGGQANFNSVRQELSADGRFVGFASGASNLVPEDTNDEWDVFVRDRVCTSPASWSNYGSGWPGTNGVPGFVATSNPTLCATVSVSADNSYGTDTIGVLFAGLSSANLVTAWGGTVLLVPALASSVLVPDTGFSISAPIPCDDSLCGLALYAQVVEMDPGASRGVSFTPGLELRLGVQ